MIRINAGWLIGIAETVDTLDKIKVGDTIMDSLAPLFSAQGSLEQVFDQSFYKDHLRTSRTLGKALHEKIGTFINDEKWDERKFSQFDIGTLKSAKDAFKTVFMADLNVIPVFIVAKKDTFDVNLLIDEGIKLFPPAIMAKVPEVEKDSQEVGRALAYELPTACGFHTFRVTESVVRRYWDTVSEGKERPKLQTLGNFSAEMEKQKLGDEKVVEAIKQMTKLHRNPLIHPEVILSVEEAIGIIGMARSVIAMMLKALPDAPTTTGAPALAGPQQ